MAATTVKHIQVAMSAKTESYESGIERSSKALKSLDAAAKKVTSQMGRLAGEFQQGVITKEQYGTAIAKTQKDLDAINAGFVSHGAAVDRASAITREAQTEVERYRAAIAELNKLKSIGAIKEADYAKALERTTAKMEAARVAETGGGATGGGIKGRMGSLAKLTASRLGIPTGLFTVGAPLVAVAALSKAVQLLGRSLSEIEEKAKAAGVTLSTITVASARSFTQETNALSASWVKFKDGFLAMAAPVTYSLKAMSWALAGVLGLLGEGLGKLAQWREKWLPEMFGGGLRVLPELAGPVEAGQLEQQRAKVRAASEQAAEESADKQKEIAKSLDDYYAKIADRVGEIRNKFADAITPLQQQVNEAAEINDLFAKGAIGLEERNKLLFKSLAIYRQTVAEAMAERAAKAKEMFDKRMKDATSAAQQRLSQILQAGEPKQAPTVAALERGTAGAFSAFQAARSGQDREKQLLNTQKEALRFIRDMAKRGIILTAPGLTK